MQASQIAPVINNQDSQIRLDARGIREYSRQNKHVANICDFIVHFLRTQGCTYRDPQNSDMETVRNAVISSGDILLNQACAINKLMIEAFDRRGEPVEMKEEWLSQEVQDGLFHVLKRRGLPVKKIKTPKRWITAYEFFCMEKRTLVMKMMPYAKVQQVNQYLGDWWSMIKQLECHRLEYLTYLAMERKDKARFNAKSGRYIVLR